MALVAVDDHVLDQLVEAATTDAAPDDVTPPLTAGHVWTPTRIAWLRDFHRDRRAGLHGPTGESTWAVTIEQQVVGSVRLRHTDRQGRVEIGMWLIRAVRGHGVARAAMTFALCEAAELGVTSVWAETTVGNAGALGLLARLGFDLGPSDHQGCIHALLVFDPRPEPAQGPLS